MAKRPLPNAATANLGFEAKLWQAAYALRSDNRNLVSSLRWVSACP